MESSFDYGHASASNAAATRSTIAARPAAANSAATISTQIQALASLLNKNLRNALRDEEIGAAQWKVLKQIEQMDPVSVGAIAARLETSTSTIEKLADQLVDLGYVGQDSCGRLELAPVGLAVIRRVENAVKFQQNWMRLNIDQHDLSIFQQVCESMAGMLNSAEDARERAAA